MASLSGLNFKLDGKTITSFVAGESIILSISHHWFNFWGLSWEKQALLTFVVAPILAFLIWLFLTPLWSLLPTVKRNRYILFSFPILIFASIITWRAFSAPMAWHQLEIRPAQRLSSLQTIQLLEIKVPGVGNTVVQFSQLKGLKGWVIHDGILSSNSTTPNPIQYSFFGPINKDVVLTFLTPQQTTPLTIVLDGKVSDVTLDNSNAGQSVISLETQYTRYQVTMDGRILAAFIICVDFIALVFILGLLFLLGEISQSGGMSQPAKNPGSIFGHKASLLILILLSSIFHILNAFSVPLFLGSDSPTYLQGALHWLQFHNLDYVWPYGPGMALLLAPVLAVFGRNAWGIKILLHLLAFACVPLSYRIGWQLTRRYPFAFLTGLMTALTPDLFLYSNFIMSEVPNVFLGLLFCTALLSALETFSWRWLITSMLVGAFSVLLRPENAVLLVVGVSFLGAKAIYDLKARPEEGARMHPLFGLKIPDSLWRLGLALLLAVIPLLGWSANNYLRYGFFGLSNYMGDILYDGWIYFGEASRFPVTDQDSPAVTALQRAYQSHADPSGRTDTPTGWYVYQALLQDGYSSAQAFSIMETASKDSIVKNPQRSIELLFIKFREGFTPETQAAVTFHLPGEPPQTRTMNSVFFDDDNIAIPALIYLQRNLYQFLERYYQSVYPIWIWLCIGAIFLCLFRKPFFLWGPILAITAYRLFFPQIIGLANWRYAISGIVLVQIFALAVCESLIVYLIFAIRHYTKRTTT